MGASWHVDERRPDRLRWWTGEAWAHDTAHPEALRRRQVLARRWGVAAAAALALVAVALLHLWWLTRRTAALLERVPSDLPLSTDWAAYLRVAGESRTVRGADGQEVEVVRADLEALVTMMPDLSRAGSWVWAPLLVAAVCWTLWQHHLSQLLPPSTVRWSPEMHGAGWWIPLANLVLPLLTLAELRRRLRQRERARPDLLLAAWWVGWLATAVLLPQLVWRWTRLQETGQLREELLAATPALGALLVATVVALALLLRTSSAGAAYVARVPEVSPHRGSTSEQQRRVTRSLR